MPIVNVHEAKTHLSRFLERVASGEEFIIARNGKPIARLVPVSSQQRQPGRLKGRIRIGRDFDDPLPVSIGSAFSGHDP